jgi:hypothetical protein
MKVRYESDFQVGRFEGRDAPVKHSGFGATHDARAEVDQIRTIANDDGGCRTRPVRIGYWRPRAQ